MAADHEVVLGRDGKQMATHFLCVLGEGRECCVWLAEACVLVIPFSHSWQEQPGSPAKELEQELPCCTFKIYLTSFFQKSHPTVSTGWLPCLPRSAGAIRQMSINYKNLAAQSCYITSKCLTAVRQYLINQLVSFLC